MTPIMKNGAVKKVGRPSDNKTTLARLREMLTVPKERKFLKRKGQYKVERAKLPVRTVANWLNVKDDTIRCIERGRPGYRLTTENAEKISHQTAVFLDWLLAGDVSKPIINSLGKPYTQKDFDDRQKSLLHPSPDYDLRRARFALASCCAKIAAILVRGTERGQPAEYTYKLNKALRSVYFDKDENPVWHTRYIPAINPDDGGLNFSPLVFVFESDLRKIQRKNKAVNR